MRRIALFAACIVAVGVAGLLVAQQKYPNLPDLPVLLDNDHAVVQRMDSEPGEWAGEHTHSGRQLVVILEKMAMTYKENGKETERSFKAGEVFWIDKVTHDHKALTKGSAVLVTLK